MFMLLITLLAVVELGANIWLNNFYRCDFEDDELFKHADPEINRKICIESLAYGMPEQQLYWKKGTGVGGAGLDKSLVIINSQGFRNPEFSEIKPENTFRIFTIGGSTTFGAGVLDNQTYPYFLQELYDSSDLNFKVEVINAGWPANWSVSETRLIKNTILSFDPDLFIVYDGWNELIHVVKNDKSASPQLWKERWIEICELGKKNGYQTIVTLQPSANTGEKILTEQEYLFTTRITNKKLVEPYPQYAEQLAEMEKHCTLTADLRGLFDNIPEPIYFDIAHTGPRGNQIIAEKMFQLSLPLVIEGHENKDLNNNYHDTDEINNQMVSKNFYLSYEEFTQTLKSMIAPYKTPTVIKLIFEK